MVAVIHELRDEIREFKHKTEVTLRVRIVYSVV